MRELLVQMGEAHMAARGLLADPASAILDVELVNRMLVVVNAAFLAASGGPVRQPLRAALTGA